MTDRENAIEKVKLARNCANPTFYHFFWNRCAMSYDTN